MPEEESAHAGRLLKSGVTCVAPDLIRTEVANALWKKVRRWNIPAGEAPAILELFDKVPIDILPSRPLLLSALNLAIRLGRTVYDCLYLALAIERNCALVTADAKFAASLSASPFSGNVRVLSRF